MPFFAGPNGGGTLCWREPTTMAPAISRARMTSATPIARNGTRGAIRVRS